MPLRERLREALPVAMRARDKAAVSALRSALAALDDAEAVPLDEHAPRAAALEHSPRGARTTEAPRRTLTGAAEAAVVRAEAVERLDAAAQLTAPSHADRAARLRAEAAVLLDVLDGAGAGRDDGGGGTRP